MRVSNSGFTNHVSHTLRGQSARLGQLYDQLTSGKRLRQLSDDPGATVRSLRAHASLAELDARQTVAQQAVKLTGSTDTVLAEVAGALGNAKNLCLEGMNDTLDATARQALAAQVRSLQAELVTTGNTEVQGQYLFAGSRTDTPPLQTSDTANLPVLYEGNHRQLEYVAGEAQMPVGLTAAQVFNYAAADGSRPVDGVDRDVFSVLEDVATALERGDMGQLQTLASQVEALHMHVVNSRAEVGVQQQRWQSVLDRVSGTAVLLNQVVSDEESVDYAATLVELSNLQTAYQASLNLTAQMLALPNLFEVK